MTSLTLPSPAKLNLFLHINGRLENGYHELQSLFHFIDFGDQLSFTLNDSGHITIECPIAELISQDNLIVKAALLLKQHCQLPDDYGVHIRLDKKLPMGGGVGGGSSNAATTLLALNKLWQLQLSNEQLRELGKQLGADVPIFVFGHSAIADGIGEKLTNYPIAQKWYLVIMPNVHINTAQLFQSAMLKRDSEKIAIDQIQYQGLRDDLQNNFQPLVTNQYPAVAKALDWLLQYVPARLTGTGACVFAEFDNHQQAQQLFQQLPDDWSGFVAKGCNESPTHQMLYEQLNE